MVSTRACFNGSFSKRFHCIRLFRLSDRGNPSLGLAYFRILYYSYRYWNMDERSFSIQIEENKEKEKS